MMNGRGAWTAIGMPPGATGFYKLMSPERVGDFGNITWPNDDPIVAVNYGVKTIQRRINGLGWLPRLEVDGAFGERTDVAVRFVQGILGLSGDGSVGPKTMLALMWPMVKVDAPFLHKTIGGMIQNESGWDPGAVSSEWKVENGPDRGLVQINEKANPTVTIAAMFHHRLAFQYANKRLTDSLMAYGNLDIAIAHHNSPTEAEQWAETGVAPNARIAGYVQRIKSWQPPS